MRRPFVVGNWKMNGDRAAMAEARAIADVAAANPAVDVGLCPPFTLIAAMREAAPGLCVGGQDCHPSRSGAFTGSISAAMLAEAGASIVIVGHSERREALGETSALVQAKAGAAVAAGLRTILCVGEPLAVRQAGRAEAFVLEQVEASLSDELLRDPSRIALAYEPIWAIGTGQVAQPADIAAMHGAIRGALGRAGAAVPLLYGGSVNAANASAILSLEDVDGALVGGASLTCAAFAPIVEAAAAALRG